MNSSGSGHTARSVADRETTEAIAWFLSSGRERTVPHYLAERIARLHREDRELAAILTNLDAQSESAGLRSSVAYFSVHGQRYVYREVRTTREKFDKEVQILRTIADNSLGPRLFVYGQPGFLILEYVPHEPWPAYADDRLPYAHAMQSLRRAHDVLEVSEGATAFDFVCDMAHQLRGTLPKQFDTAVRTVELIQEELEPWLQTHAVMCHGDFHKDNVLRGRDRISLIDWTGAPLL